MWLRPVWLRPVWLRNATSRLLAAHLVLVALSTAMVLAFVYYSTRDVIEAGVREVVAADLRGLGDDYRDGGVLGLTRAINRRLADRGRRDTVYLLADHQGNRIAGNLAGWPPVVPPQSGWVELDLYRNDRERVTTLSVAAITLPTGERLLVGHDSEAQRKFRRTLLGALGWALAAAGLLALASGWLLSRFVGRRVADVVETADEIVQGDMARRVPVRGGGDEFDRLAGTLNRMLDRIQGLVDDLRMVTDAVAHDLRSPLTRLRAHLESSLEEELDKPSRHERIGRAIAEADGVLRALTALLEIARAEAGMGRDQFEAVDLGRLAADMVDLYTPSAAEKSLRLVQQRRGCDRLRPPAAARQRSRQPGRERHRARAGRQRGDAGARARARARAGRRRPRSRHPRRGARPGAGALRSAGRQPRPTRRGARPVARRRRGAPARRTARARRQRPGPARDTALRAGRSRERRGNGG